MSSIAATEPEPNARYLWTVLREYVRHACALFGAPSEIAKKIWLTRAEHKLICGWLRPLEALLRRLIMLDALALLAAPAPEPTPAPEHKTRTRRGMNAAFGAGFDPERSETWRASFRLDADSDRRRVISGRGGLSAVALAEAEAATSETRRPMSAQPGVAAHFPCQINAVAAAPPALRLEALVRGYNSREQLAARWARKMRRKPQQAAAALTPRRRLPNGPGWPPVHDAVRLLRNAVEALLSDRVPHDSS